MINKKKDVPGSRIYFSTDGTKPDPFQTGRTGKASTHKYIGPFRLQPGSRVVRAIAVTRDRLKESPVATRYIDVTLDSTINNNSSNLRQSDYENNDSSYSDEEDNNNRGSRRRSSNRSINDEPRADMAEVQGSIDGPINPVNYSGTQINIWGFPTPEIGNLIEPKPANLGFLTEQMIKNLNTPRAIEQKPSECKSSS